MAKAKAKTTKKTVQPAVKAKPEAVKPTPKPKPKPITLAKEDKKVVKKEIITVNGSELLMLVTGFEGVVAELKALELKVAANNENKVLNRQLEAQKRIVQAFIDSIKAVKI